MGFKFEGYSRVSLGLEGGGGVCSEIRIPG